MSNNDKEPVEKPRQDKTKPKREWCSFPRAVEDSISAGKNERTDFSSADKKLIFFVLQTEARL